MSDTVVCHSHMLASARRAVIENNIYFSQENFFQVPSASKYISSNVLPRENEFKFLIWYNLLNLKKSNTGIKLISALKCNSLNTSVIIATRILTFRNFCLYFLPNRHFHFVLCLESTFFLNLLLHINTLELNICQNTCFLSKLDVFACLREGIVRP